MGDKPKKYLIDTPLRRNGKTIPTGKTVELGDEEAAPLLACKAIRPVVDEEEEDDSSTRAAQPGGGWNDPRPEDIVKGSVAEVQAALSIIESETKIEAVRAAEEAREGGPRKGVLEAIDARIEELQE